MTDFSWLDARDSASLFNIQTGHLPITLQRLRGARMLWLNQRAAGSDPAFAALSGDMAAYERHMLDTCAYAVSDSGDGFDDADQITGLADRYGGFGIGRNGGSGRAAVIGGYLVKGIGRTALIGKDTDWAHASGGAYLEEAVRESIFAEIIGAEFPHSAVPVLAIIDTGLVQDWGSKKERRVLLVRPCFVRPAHYVRAVAYLSGNPTEGASDSARVQQMFRASERLVGQADLRKRYQALWTNWTAQTAYGFVHRLSHGSNTTSNICFDGKLLDFGATSAVPSWADVATVLARQSFDDLHTMVPHAMRTHAYYFGRYLDPVLTGSAAIESLCASITQTFRNVVATEMLRLAGVTRSVATAEVARDGSWWLLAWQLIRWCQRERFELLDNTHLDYGHWDFARVWDSDVPDYLRPLRQALETIVPIGERDRAARRAALLTASRPGLYRETAKDAMYIEVDPSQNGAAPQRATIERFIMTQVAHNRRDQHWDPVDAICIGFAVGADATRALFRHEDGSLFAIDECSGMRQELRDRNALLLQWSAQDGHGIPCAVALYDEPDGLPGCRVR